MQVTLFHYRKTGNRSSPILLGLQVPPDTESDLEAATEVGLFQIFMVAMPQHAHMERLSRMML